MLFANTAVCLGLVNAVGIYLTNLTVTLLGAVRFWLEYKYLGLDLVHPRASIMWILFVN